MSKIEIDGNVLDSFNVAFYHDKWAIDPKHISMKIEEELHERLHVCRKMNKTYAVYVVIAELEGDRDAVSQRKESEDEERFFRKRQA
jgi:hypothetical protein